METILRCPLCSGSEFREYIHLKDHFLSGEEFVISECISCGFRFTNPRPDETEIARYYDSPDYIAHDTSAFTPIQVLYTSARRFALRKKYSMISRFPAGKNLLDIGCGTGEFLSYVRKKGYTVSGIEPGVKARNFAISRFSLPVYDVTQLDMFRESTFDVVTMWHVLEHVHTLQQRMDTIHRILQRNGLLIIAVPNSDSWDAAFYGATWAAFDVPRHLYHFTPATLKGLLVRSGFLLEKILPLKLDAYYISLLSEKYKTGQQNFLRALHNGFRSNSSARKNMMNYSSLVYICRPHPDAK